MSSSTPSTSFGEGPIRVGGGSFSRPAAIIGGATALIAVTAIATTLVVRAPSHTVGDIGAEARSAPVAAQSLPSNPTPSRATGQVVEERADAPKAAPVNATRAASAKPTAAAKPPAERVAAAVCAQCGVVEAVTPFQQKGDGTGVGAVGGAVVGGLLGSQIGGGGGKKAMTVIGAVGGGLAGNEIEKRQRATTLYSVKVRMEDGSLRTLTQATAPTVGQKVSVDGGALKPRA
jgi:outer membrane lipoprotein SlyB